MSRLTFTFQMREERHLGPDVRSLNQTFFASPAAAAAAKHMQRTCQAMGTCAWICARVCLYVQRDISILKDDGRSERDSSSLAMAVVARVAGVREGEQSRAKEEARRDIYD